MNQNAVALLLAWPVLSLAFFATLGPWRGVIATYLGAYLLLPGFVVIPMSGIPDYSKYTAANLAALVGLVIFDAGRLLAFRPRWYDLIVLVLCAVPLASIPLNGLDTWLMVSVINDLVQSWGIPYFIGRLFFNQPGADRTLALGMTISGLLLLPALAFEVVTEQSLRGLVYGQPFHGVHKYGLYSPAVFANNALEMGIWVSLTTLSAFALWCTRSVRTLLGAPFGTWMLVLMAGPVLCHQTGALALLGLGILLIAMTAGRERFGKLPETLGAGGVLMIAPKLGGKLSLIGLLFIMGMRHLRDHRPRLLTAAITSIVPLYLIIRVTKAVSQSTLTFLAYLMLNSDRGQSLSFRISTEVQMIDHVMLRPFFGWGTYLENRGKPTGVVILDSLWVIYMGLYGFVGLVALYGLLCLPVLLLGRRRPADTWGDPRNGPAVALMFVLLIYTFDSMFNAYNIMPIPLLAGLVMTLPPLVGRSRRWFAEAAADRQLDHVDRLAAMGRVDEAEAACRRVISLRSADPAAGASLADACDRRADLLEVLDRLDEADPVRRRALELRIAAAGASPGDPQARAALAGCLERLARNLVIRGHESEAAECRGLALEQRAALAAGFPDVPGLLEAYADDLNDLAWMLSVGGDPSLGDPPRAVAMAEQAVRIRPGCKSYWNTLGAAYYRAGDPGSALAALRQSLRLGPDETGFDEVLRALALASLGDADGAREALARVDSLRQDGRQAPASLLRLRAEAADRLGSSVPAVVS